eukprot:TRINITY_DN669_c0_g1_i1.p1 TRINITY_DN669_c0_g1~~TRINITY_DN669_c0_g1_i1.p1  ORF type:complete len:344 (+),score=53.21 TRINITY_DN669_c0_g1_i1:473-1504(+)
MPLGTHPFRYLREASAKPPAALIEQWKAPSMSNNCAGASLVEGAALGPRSSRGYATRSPLAGVEVTEAKLLREAKARSATLLCCELGGGGADVKSHLANGMTKPSLVGRSGTLQKLVPASKHFASNDSSSELRMADCDGNGLDVVGLQGLAEAGSGMRSSSMRPTHLAAKCKGGEAMSVANVPLPSQPFATEIQLADDKPSVGTLRGAIGQLELVGGQARSLLEGSASDVLRRRNSGDDGVQVTYTSRMKAGSRLVTKGHPKRHHERAPLNPNPTLASLKLDPAPSSSAVAAAAHRLRSRLQRRTGGDSPLLLDCDMEGGRDVRQIAASAPSSKEGEGCYVSL